MEKEECLHRRDYGYLEFEANPHLPAKSPNSGVGLKVELRFLSLPLIAIGWMDGLADWLQCARKWRTDGRMLQMQAASSKQTSGKRASERANDGRVSGI